MKMFQMKNGLKRYSMCYMMVTTSYGRKRFDALVFGIRCWWKLEDVTPFKIISNHLTNTVDAKQM